MNGPEIMDSTSRDVDQPEGAVEGYFGILLTFVLAWVVAEPLARLCGGVIIQNW